VLVRNQEVTEITQCPQCGTHFKITQEQRQSHEGMVRCGQCQSVFNAVEHLYTEPAQLDLPLVLDDIADVPSIYSIYDPYSTIEPGLEHGSSISISPQAAARLANDFSHLADVYVTPHAKPSSPQRTWLWAVASLLIFLVLLLQIIYFLRVDIAAWLPGLKPAMTSICEQLDCSLPLPQKIDLLSIESSELEADPTQSNIITLHALLRSHAPYALAYPSIELTLTDTQDNALARRTFSPADYLPPGTDEIQGFPANRESTIKLHLNTTDLKPAGYRLYLYYPSVLSAQ
jgi:predicted Zn finger-like uncharacterized protein